MPANEFRIWAQDSMSRIFPHQTGPRTGGDRIALWAARNEVESFQIGVHGRPDLLNDLRADASDLVSEDGAKIEKARVEVLYGEYVPVHWHSPGNVPDDLEGSAPGFYPDPLLPELWRGVSRIEFPGTVGMWVRVRVPTEAAPGSYRGTVRVTCKGGSEEIEVSLNVWPFALPDRSHFLMTNWLVIEPILQFHRVEPCTEDFWDVIERYARNLADHRQNVILTRFGPMGGTLDLLDGRVQGQLVDIVEEAPGQYAFDFRAFDRWVECFLEYGFERIEGGHLAGGSTRPSAYLIRRPGASHAEHLRFSSTQEPEYRAFLRQFLETLRGHLGERGWLDRFYLHLSDEPHGDQFDAYTGLAKFVKEIAPEIPLMDAMGAPEYAPYVDHPEHTRDARYLANFRRRVGEAIAG